MEGDTIEIITIECRGGVSPSAVHAAVRGIPVTRPGASPRAHSRLISPKHSTDDHRLKFELTFRVRIQNMLTICIFWPPSRKLIGFKTFWIVISFVSVSFLIFETRCMIKKNFKIIYSY